MANDIKMTGEGYSLQVTREAREAELVEERPDGDVRRLADVRVHAFEDLLLVVDVDRVDDEHEADLVEVATRETGTAYQAINATVTTAGNGYRVQLPPARDAGFREGDSAPAHPARGLLVIVPDDRDGQLLARDFVTIRRDQVGQ